ncbi:hypothetical protein Tco_0026072 [Tanacetum coccineum]
MILYATNVEENVTFSSQQKPKLRPTKDFEAKYNKVKAKLALLSFSASASKSSMVKVLMALADDENVAVGKESCISEQIPTQKKRILGVDQLTEDPSSLGQKDLVFVKSSADDIKVSILGVERPWLSEVEGFILPNHDAGRILLADTPLPPLEKLVGVEPVSGPETIKSILKSNSTFKVETLKGSEKNSALAGKLKNMKTEDGFLCLL